MDINASKESQIAEQMAASLGYSNKDNPFMDSNLNSKFVWVKKRQIEGKQGITSEHRVVRDKIKMEETKVNKTLHKDQIEILWRVSDLSSRCSLYQCRKE